MQIKIRLLIALQRSLKKSIIGVNATISIMLIITDVRFNYLNIAYKNHITSNHNITNVTFRKRYFEPVLTIVLVFFNPIVI